jgi:hypothetical protein
MVVDGIDSARVAALARCGRGGDQNKERDLHRWLHNLHGQMPEPYYVEFNLLTSTSALPKAVLIPVLLPHEMMHCIWQAGPLQRMVSLFGEEGADGLAEFWTHSLPLPWAQAHPGLAAMRADPANMMEKTFPVRVHCDGAEVFRNNEFFIWDWGSATVLQGHVADAKFPAVLIPHWMMRENNVKNNVHRIVAEVFAWSFKALQSGTAPLRGLKGEEFNPLSYRAKLAGLPLMEGHTAVFVGWKGDGKARKECHFFFTRNWSCRNCCDECHATQPFARTPPDLLYTDTRPTANWRATFISHESYVANCAAHELSPWAVVPGFRKELVHRDGMHDQCLGVQRDLAGTIIAELLDHGWLAGASVDEQLRGLWLEFIVWCKAQHIKPPHGTFSLSLIGWTKRTEYPELSTSYKAVVIKLLCSFLASKVQTCNTGNEHDNVRALTAWAMSEWCHVVDHSGQWPNTEEIHRMEFAMRCYVFGYSWLAAEAATMNRFMWKERPKFHYLEHHLDALKRTGENPKAVQCWMEETLMGRVKRTGSHCHATSAILRFFQRHVLYLSLRWERRRRLRRFTLPP